jgi:hypothetical protein
VTGLFCDALVLHREICITQDCVNVHDRIENVRGVPADYCLLYHCNFGAPFLEEGGEVKIDYLTREGLTPLAREKEDVAASITAPIPADEETVYYHTVKEGCARYFNPRLGLGVRVTYDAQKLPFLLEWKSMAEDDYALGLEPCTTILDDKFEYSKLAAGEKINFFIELKVTEI